jgi:hypothetical protein
LGSLGLTPFDFALFDLDIDHPWFVVVPTILSLDKSLVVKGCMFLTSFSLASLTSDVVHSRLLVGSTIQSGKTFKVEEGLFCTSFLSALFTSDIYHIGSLMVSTKLGAGLVGIVKGSASFAGSILTDKTLYICHTLLLVRAAVDWSRLTFIIEDRVFFTSLMATFLGSHIGHILFAMVLAKLRLPSFVSVKSNLETTFFVTSLTSYVDHSIFFVFSAELFSKTFVVVGWTSSTTGFFAFLASYIDHTQTVVLRTLDGNGLSFKVI